MNTVKQIKDLSKRLHDIEYDRLLWEENTLLAFVRKPNNPLSLKKEAMIRMAEIEERQKAILLLEVP